MVWEVGGCDPLSLPPPFNNDISAQRSVTCNDQCDTLDWALHVTCLFLTHFGIIYDTLLKMGWQLGISLLISTQS